MRLCNAFNFFVIIIFVVAIHSFVLSNNLHSNTTHHLDSEQMSDAVAVIVDMVAFVASCVQPSWAAITRLDTTQHLVLASQLKCN